MDISALESLSDDDLREQLEKNGYAPPPITDDAVRELMRRKLFKLLNPGAEYPKNEASESSSHEEDEGGDADVHQRHNFGAGDTAPTIASHSNVRTKVVGEQQRRSKFPIVVAVGFVILNIFLAATIFYRDLLF